MNYITPIFTADTIDQIRNTLTFQVHEGMQNLEHMLNEKSLRDDITISLGDAKFGDGTEVSEYEVKVVGRFRLEGDLIIILEDGHYLNVSKLVRDTIDIRKS